MVTDTKPRPHQHFNLRGSRKVRDPKPDPKAPKTPGLYPGGCVHHFLIDSDNIGTCRFCGEEREYPWALNGNKYAVLKKGNYGAPLEGGPDKTKEENIMPTPEQKAKMMGKNAYYKKNKEAIIKDLKTIGRPATRKTWDIPSPSMYSLEKRWLSKEERAEISKLSRKLPSPKGEKSAELKPGHNGDGRELPAFPAFSDEWSDSVKREWFKSYCELATSVVKGG